MKVLIPIRCTDVLNSNVERSILVQTIKSDIELFVNTPISTCSRKGQFEGYDKIVNRAKELTDEFVVTNESNAWHRYVDNFQCMSIALKSDSTLGAIVLWRYAVARKPLSNYDIVGSCMMWKTKVLASMPMLDYEGSNYGTCCCARYKEAIEKQGFKAQYLDEKQRIIEISECYKNGNRTK